MPPTAAASTTSSSAELVKDIGATRRVRRLSLATRSEALFSCEFSLNLPASVFAGATALGFLSYVTGILSATYDRSDGVVKQIGFLWAPNWTFVFMVLLPLFFLLVTELLVFWKVKGRTKLAKHKDPMEGHRAWMSNVESSSATYRAVFLVCILFAGLFQWIEVCLIPLMNGNGEYAIDWGKLAIVRPDVISVPEEVLFTASAYLYMAISFYIFFAGLILLYTIAHDCWRIGRSLEDEAMGNQQSDLNEVGQVVIRTIFRCTILGVLVGICMKGQSSYLTSTEKNIAAWLINDMSSAIQGRSSINDTIGYRTPTHYSSLLVVTSTCIVFLFGLIRLGLANWSDITLWKMATIIALLVAGYLFTGAFTGFSILLGLGVIFALYGLFDPGFGRERASEKGPIPNAP